VPLPHTSERHPALQAVLEQQAASGQRAAIATGAPVRAVVAVAADSHVAVLDAATGFFLSRYVLGRCRMQAVVRFMQTAGAADF
jgi:hypothetical protein